MFLVFIYFIKVIIVLLNVFEDEIYVSVFVYGDVFFLVLDFNDYYNQLFLENVFVKVMYFVSFQSNLGEVLLYFVFNFYNISDV